MENRRYVYLELNEETVRELQGASALGVRDIGGIVTGCSVLWYVLTPLLGTGLRCASDTPRAATLALTKGDKYGRETIGRSKTIVESDTK